MARLSTDGNRIDQVFDQYTGESISYTKITNLPDGTTVTDAKCDGVIYRKFGTSYFKRNVSSFVDVRWWGVIGDGTTENKIAFEKVLASIALIVANPTDFSGSASINRPWIYFPAGYYKITNPYNKILLRGFKVRGDGPENTCIKYIATTNDSVLFDIGNFNSDNPGTGFQTGGGFQMENIKISIGDGLAGVYMDGTRKGQVIRDNGTGDIWLNNVRIQGYNYGFNGVMGSDYCNFNNTYFEWCNVGCYWGPGAEQTVIFGGGCHNNLEGMVFERCTNITIYGTAFLANKNGQVVFEAFNGRTRQLNTIPTVSPPPPEASILFVAPWMETFGGGGANSMMCKQWVKFQGNSTSLYAGIEFYKPTIVAGGNSGDINDRSECFFDFSVKKANYIKLTDASFATGGTMQYIAKDPDDTTFILVNLKKGSNSVLTSNNGKGIVKNQFTILPTASLTSPGEVLMSAASEDTTGNVSAMYSQTEVQAILNELRDLKAKMRNAGLLDI